MNRFRKLVFPFRGHPLRSVFVVGLLALLGWGVVWAGRYFWAEHHFRVGERALRQLDFDEAREHLALCLKVWPRSGEVQCLAAQAARRAGAYEEAELHLQESLRLTGGTPGYALERDLLSGQEGEMGGNVEETLRVLAGQNDHLALLSGEALAQGYLAQHRAPEAIDCLNLLLERRPDHFRALLWRARAWEVLDRHELALADCQRAVDLAPEAVEARLQLASLLYQAGRVPEAVDHYERLHQRQPDNPEVLLGLARCLHDLHERDQARRLLDALLAGHPEDEAALVERGRLAFHSGQPAEAEDWFRRAAALDVHDREAYSLLSLAQESQGKTEEARQTLARVKAIEADSTQATRLTIRCGASPHDPALRCDLGIFLLGTGSEEQGLYWLFSALNEDHGFAPARAALADYFERTGRPNRAARYRKSSPSGAGGYHASR